MRQLCHLSLSLRTRVGFRWLSTILLAALLGVALGHVVLGSVGSISVVDGESMAPTFRTGARVFTGPISTPLERGDVVLLNDRRRDFALKRIVGLPGETVHLWRGYVFINRRLLRESYLPKFTYTFPDEQTETLAFHLDAGQYFVLGDNRLCSLDSRNYGPVSRERIKSRVPPAESSARAYVDAYTLPAAGKRTIRSL
jgi:signal peptidase I